MGNDTKHGRGCSGAARMSRTASMRCAICDSTSGLLPGSASSCMAAYALGDRTEGPQLQTTTLQRYLLHRMTTTNTASRA